MELFDELVESEVSIVTPHLKALVEFCLQVCNSKIVSEHAIQCRLALHTEERILTVMLKMYGYV